MDLSKLKQTLLQFPSSGLIFLLTICFISCDVKNDDYKFTRECRIEHLVLFKFKPTITPQEKQEVINRFMALNNSLKDGKRYVKIEYGLQNSKVIAKGNYDIGFRVTFSSLEDRDYYVGKLMAGQRPPAMTPCMMLLRTL
ncbi:MULTISPECIES: Dabb family protein [Elizabethkingia]|uniref:Stress-response A/B barrel domain-containing protein n=1 Tax=Elizabethkingia ursingii TaxID=1756150 RepID=A0AAJ3TQ10_9FLAO|nr:MULTISPECIES: Dabb family protein [Elizabethkingia]AQW92896.1 hypothetical protein BBD30_01130 [Elizabethkingia anophelis]AQX09814.1 hypothetical protein BBD34_14740 [Elizabethkingia ursingii]OPB60815.1 hypothetical protein BAS07_17515 [Elizabethkingia anophelis]OPB78933.1 hypothetical protein BAY32_18915 [Elizabethkingia ursingii]OPB91635.1 hypothetical protein BB021_17145 [Elizabethkingia ursingii]